MMRPHSSQSSRPGSSGVNSINNNSINSTSRPPSRLKPLKRADSSQRHNRSTSSNGGSHNGSTRGHSPQTVAEKRAASAMSGKMAKYSSTSTEFSPSHVPIDTNRIHDMASRLYTPQSLQRRTFVDQQQRREKNQQTTYNATTDANLAQFWARQQELKEIRRLERQARNERIDSLMRGEYVSPTRNSKLLTPPRKANQKKPPPGTKNNSSSKAATSNKKTTNASQDYSDDDSDCSSVMSSPTWVAEDQRQKDQDLENQEEKEATTSTVSSPAKRDPELDEKKPSKAGEKKQKPAEKREDKESSRSVSEDSRRSSRSLSRSSSSVDSRRSSASSRRSSRSPSISQSPERESKPEEKVKKTKIVKKTVTKTVTKMERIIESRQFHILRCTGLADEDPFGQNDPFVVVKKQDGSVLHTTKAKDEAGSVAVWKEESFELQEPVFSKLVNDGESLLVTVMDMDVGSDDVIGSGTLTFDKDTIEADEKELLTSNKDDETPSSKRLGFRVKLAKDDGEEAGYCVVALEMTAGEKETTMDVQEEVEEDVEVEEDEQEEPTEESTPLQSPEKEEKEDPAQEKDNRRSHQHQRKTNREKTLSHGESSMVRFEQSVIEKEDEKEKEKSQQLVPVEEAENDEEGEEEEEEEGEDIVPVIETVARKDLTALWMIAKPPPSYQSGIRKLGIHHKDFDLGWLLVEEEAMPAPGGTIFNIPIEADDMEEAYEFSLTSPRSMVVMLRNGVTLDEVVPKGLFEFYHEGELQGKPKYLCEKRFTAHDKRRKHLLAKVRKDYSTICSSVSQEHIVDVLRSIDPSKHPDFPINSDGMEITESRRGSSSLTRKLSIYDKRAKSRTAVAMELQYKRQAKFERHLERNKELVMDRVRAGKEAEAREQEKARQIQERRLEEMRERARKSKERSDKVKTVISEGKALVEAKRQHILDKVAEHEFVWDRKQEAKKFEAMSVAEENSIIKEQKKQNMVRRERLAEYRKLCTLDKIRRKLDKANAAAANDFATTKKLREEREKAGVEMRKLSKKHEEEVLAVQRKETNRAVNDFKPAAKRQQSSRSGSHNSAERIEDRKDPSEEQEQKKDQAQSEEQQEKPPMEEEKPAEEEPKEEAPKEESPVKEPEPQEEKSEGAEKPAEEEPKEEAPKAESPEKEQEPQEEKSEIQEEEKLVEAEQPAEEEEQQPATQDEERPEAKQTTPREEEEEEKKQDRRENSTNARSPSSTSRSASSSRSRSSSVDSRRSSASSRRSSSSVDSRRSSSRSGSRSSSISPSAERESKPEEAPSEKKMKTVTKMERIIESRQFHILRCTGLADEDPFGQNDPFVVVKKQDGSVLHTTKAKDEAGSVAVWKEESFELQEPVFSKLVNDGESLTITVLDKDVGSDDVIGSGTLTFDKDTIEAGEKELLTTTNKDEETPSPKRLGFRVKLAKDDGEEAGYCVVALEMRAGEKVTTSEVEEGNE